MAFNAGDSSTWGPHEIEADIGVGVKKYRYTFDGKEFQWECYDGDRWYSLIGKNTFRDVLKRMRGEEGGDWGKPEAPSSYKSHNVRVYRRKPTYPEARIDEIKMEGDIPNLKPEELYNVMHEHAYRATWDQKMVKGYNISQFSLNNDIGYYEAKVAAMVANRDFVNQRAWIEMGEDEFMITSVSTPHKSKPEGSKVVRARAFVTAYYMRPCATNPSSTTLTYLTCTDPNGAIPTWVINTITTKFGPATYITLDNAAKKLPEWKKKLFIESNGAPVAGPWDSTALEPGKYIPPNPCDRPCYRLQEMPLYLEETQVKDLMQEQHDDYTALVASCDSEFEELSASLKATGKPAEAGA